MLQTDTSLITKGYQAPILMKKQNAAMNLNKYYEHENYDNYFINMLQYHHELAFHAIMN